MTGAATEDEVAVFVKCPCLTTNRVPDMHAAAEDRTPPLCQINKRHVCAFCCPTQSVSASYMVLFVELHP